MIIIGRVVVTTIYAIMNIGTDSTTYFTNSFKNGLNIMRKEFDWASLWTDWSVWPDGLTCSEDPLLYCVAATCHQLVKLSPNRPIVLPNHPNRSPNCPALSPNRLVTELVS